MSGYAQYEDDAQHKNLHADDLPLEEMAVFQEPPIDVEDTSPTGVIRKVEAAPKTNPRATQPVKILNSGSSVLNWGLSIGALAVTLAAGAVYLQQNSNSAPIQQPTQTITVIDTTAVPTDPVVPTKSVS